MYNFRTIAGAAVAFALWASPASAASTTVTFGPTTGLVFYPGQPLGGVDLAAGVVTPDTVYFGSVSRDAPTTFTDEFTFDFTPLIPGSASAIVLELTDLRATPELDWFWVDPANATLISAEIMAGGLPGADSGDTINLLFTTPGVYTLRLIGEASGPAGGSYTFNLSTGHGAPGDVPLPGSMVLLGSVLAGGVALMRRRRRKLEQTA